MLKPPRRAAPAKPRRPLWPHRAVVGVLMLAGATVMAWPVAETFQNNEQGSLPTIEYVRSIESTLPQVLSDEFQAAQSYNASLNPRLLNDPWGADEIAASAAHSDYSQALASNKAMARIRMPEIAVDLPVFHDATKASMARGAGHMYGSSLPVGGTDTHAVIAAHTGMRSRTMFDRLPELKPGEPIYIDVAGQTLTYHVDKVSVVEPWELDEVQRIPGGDYLTLVTCYTPPGEHKQRMLVRGVRKPEPSATTERVDAVVKPAPVSADLSIQDWMWPRLYVAGGTVALFGLMLVTWVIGDLRRARRSAAHAPIPVSDSIQEPMEASR